MGQRTVNALLAALALFSLTTLHSEMQMSDFDAVGGKEELLTQVPTPMHSGHIEQGGVAVAKENSELPASNNYNEETQSAPFCSSPEGSLHQLALDMLKYSSPPGSASHTKLKEILQAHSYFYIELPHNIFTENQKNMAHMLEGFGLSRLERRPPKEWANYTLVETPLDKGLCPIEEVDCKNRSRILIQTEQYFKDKSIRRQADAYKEAKVCMVVHSYTDDSGGEYHRLSEFAPFGCIPVMETFGDTIGIDRYKECGRMVFASGPDLMEAAANVTAKIDQGWYEDYSHVDWWKAGIQWETLLLSGL